MSMCVRGVDFACDFTIFRLEFGAVTTVWYFYVFHSITLNQQQMAMCCRWWPVER